MFGTCTKIGGFVHQCFSFRFICFSISVIDLVTEGSFTTAFIYLLHFYTCIDRKRPYKNRNGSWLILNFEIRCIDLCVGPKCAFLSRRGIQRAATVMIAFPIPGKSRDNFAVRVSSGGNVSRILWDDFRPRITPSPRVFSTQKPFQRLEGMIHSLFYENNWKKMTENVVSDVRNSDVFFLVLWKHFYEIYL